jgi:hypothetical protein
VRFVLEAICHNFRTCGMRLEENDETLNESIFEVCVSRKSWSPCLEYFKGSIENGARTVHHSVQRIVSPVLWSIGGMVIN